MVLSKGNVLKNVYRIFYANNARGRVLKHYGFNNIKTITMKLFDVVVYILLESCHQMILFSFIFKVFKGRLSEIVRMRRLSNNSFVLTI
jgi:hypothetical protein